MATICELGITTGAWIAEHTVVAHPIESTWIMLLVIGWIAWLGVGGAKTKHHQ